MGEKVLFSFIFASTITTVISTHTRHVHGAIFTGLSVGFEAVDIFVTFAGVGRWHLIIGTLAIVEGTRSFSKTFTCVALSMITSNWTRSGSGFRSS